ncbi:hypothetical protein [Nocardia sp. NPDC059228]|uniref:hypothetical protein n=1 Tax=Nocardia sp. NPDC059228 TaxID=3346777 RepID=UPI0036AC81A8
MNLHMRQVQREAHHQAAAAADDIVVRAARSWLWLYADERSVSVDLAPDELTPDAVDRLSAEAVIDNISRRWSDQGGLSAFLDECAEEIRDARIVAAARGWLQTEAEQDNLAVLEVLDDEAQLDDTEILDALGDTYPGGLAAFVAQRFPETAGGAAR